MLLACRIEYKRIVKTWIMHTPSLKELSRTRGSQHARPRTSLPHPADHPLPFTDDSDSLYSKTAITSLANSHTDTPFITSIITKIRSVQRIPLKSSNPEGSSPNIGEKVGQTIRKRAMRGSGLVDGQISGGGAVREDERERSEGGLEQKVKYLEFSLAAWQQKCHELQAQLAKRHAQAQSEKQKLLLIQEQLRTQLAAAQTAIQQMQHPPRQLTIEHTSNIMIMPTENDALREAQLKIRRLQVNLLQVEKKLHLQMRELQQRKEQEVAQLRRSYVSSLRHYKSQVFKDTPGGSCITSWQQ